MRFLGNGFGKQTTLVESNVAGRCANQAAHGMAFHVFRHVKANQIDAHDVGQLFGRFGFANARGAAEQEGTDRLVVFA